MNEIAGMNVSVVAHGPATELLQGFRVAKATARGFLRRLSAYKIQLIRWPIGPILTFALWRVMYGASGRTDLSGATLSGFLVTGVFGTILLSSSIWTSGYAIEWERDEGTSGSLFLSPASRSAVVAGYGIGAFVWFVPSFVALVILAFATGASLNVADPLAATISAVAMVLASLAMGFAFAGLFILSRRGNLIANVMQPPLMLLAGFAVPLSRLPVWAQAIGNVLPLTHALEALRATTLGGADLATAGPELLLTLGTTLAFLAVGAFGLRRVEHVAR